METYSAYSDEGLVQLLAGDADKHAFTELYNRYWEKLLIQAIAKLKSEPEAKEVVQIVFMNLWKRRQQIAIRHTFNTYIASCVKYEILEKLSNQKTRTAKEQQAFKQSAAEENNTTEWLNYQNTLKQLEETVKGLPEKCQIVFRLSREQGFSEKQIAEELNISTKTVEAHITKALKVLRSSLQVFFLFYIDRAFI